MIWFNEETQSWWWKLPEHWDDETVKFFWAYLDDYHQQLYYEDMR